MNLAALETALLEFVVDAIEDCDLPSPDHAIRHHGVLPDRCCTENGILSLSWEESPAPSPTDCTGPLEWAFALRWVTCWPSEDLKPTGLLSVNYTARDAAAARIAAVTECVLAAFAGEICRWGKSDLREFAVSLRLGRTSPVTPSGLCAGVLWRIIATLRRSAEPPPT